MDTHGIQCVPFVGEKKAIYRGKAMYLLIPSLYK